MVEALVNPSDWTSNKIDYQLGKPQKKRVLFLVAGPLRVGRGPKRVCH